MNTQPSSITPLFWIAHGGRVQLKRPIKTFGGSAFVQGEALSLLRLEPGYDAVLVAVFESDLLPEKLLRLRVTDLDANITNVISN